MTLIHSKYDTKPDCSPVVGDDTVCTCTTHTYIHRNAHTHMHMKHSNVTGV